MKRVKYLLILLLVIFMAPAANALIQGEADNTLNINKNYDDTALFAGNIVSVDSNIDGLITGYKTKDLFAAGSNVAISDVTARSIYAAGGTITVQSDIENLYIAGDHVTIDGDFKNVIVEAQDFTLKGSITGKLKINDDAKQIISENAKINEIETYVGTTHQGKDFVKENSAKFIAAAIIAKIISKIFHFVNIFIIGLVFILLFKKTVTKIEKMNGNAGFIFGRFGFGLLALIVIPIISILLLITGLCSAIGIIGLVLYFLGIYLSEVIGTIYISKLVFKNMNNILRYVLTLLILTLIKLIPIIGWLLSLFMLCLSLGLILNIIKTEIKGK